MKRLGELRLDPRFRMAAIVVSIALTAIVVYANSLANGFAYDDDWIIGDRPEVHNPQLWQILTVEYWPEKFDSGLYRPLIMLSYAIDWQVWNGNPFGFHLVNVLLHAAVSVLVALLLVRFFPLWAAWAGGMLFAVHSVHTEAVANVVGRGELLSALFVLVGCLMYTRAIRQGRVPIAVMLGIAACYALASFSKEIGFVIPALLLATDIPLLARDRRFDWRSFARLRAPLFAMLTGVLLLLFAARWVILGAAVENVPDRAFTLDDSFPTRLFTMSRVWPRYAELLALPFDLSADYSPAVIMPADHLTLGGLVGFALVILVVALSIATLRRTPELAMAVGWAAVSLLPVSNLIVTIEIVLAERTLYLPSVAVSIIAALLLVKAPVQRRAWVGGLLAIWILFFSVISVRRNPVWDSTDTVFEDLRRKHPESSRLLWGLGDQFYRNGDLRGAKEWFRRSLEVWPYHAQFQSEFAQLLASFNELDEAEERAAMAVELSPHVGDYHKLLISIRLRNNDADGAHEALDTAFAVVGPDAVLHSLRADAFGLSGRLDAAAREQWEAVGLGADDWKGWYRLARYRFAAGDTMGALEALRAARETPDGVPVLADSLEGAWSGE